MSMKKIHLISTCLLIFILVPALQAQTGSTYVFFKPIYTFTGNAGKLNETVAVQQSVTYTTGVYGSYGRGFGLQAGVGKMINNNFGIELGAEFMNGSHIKTNYSTTDSSTLAGQLSERIRGVLLKPTLVLRNSGDLLSFYSKLGLAISVFSRHYADVDLRFVNAGQPYQINTSQIDNFKPKVGFTAAFGLSFRVSETIAITGELNGQMMSLPIKNGHYTQYSTNGQNQLDGLDKSSRYWTYQKSVSTAPEDPNKPGIKLYEPANFSYIGIGIGVKYFF